LRSASSLFGIPPDFALHLFAECRDACADFLQKRDGYALILLEKREEKMRVVNLRVSSASRMRERVVERLGGLYGKPVRVEHVLWTGD
jgi:hypothetical protein